jgi:drug/metabolite transporter (DMT)-like permease
VVGVVSLRVVAWAAPFTRPPILRRALTASVGGTVVGLLLMTHSQGAIAVGLSNALTSTAPLWSVPLAVLLQDERVSARAWLGTLLAVGGVALVMLA